MNVTATAEYKNVIETFFKEAFVAEEATVLPPSEKDDFDVSGIIEIKTKDRGTFYIGHMARR